MKPPGLKSKTGLREGLIAGSRKQDPAYAEVQQDPAYGASKTGLGARLRLGRNHGRFGGRFVDVCRCISGLVGRGAIGRHGFLQF